MATLNNIIALAALSFMALPATAQEAVQPASVQTTFITYSKEIPSTSTYTVTHTTKSEIPVEVLEQINAHRRHDEAVLWKVSDDLEILIYPFGVRKEESHE